MASHRYPPVIGGMETIVSQIAQSWAKNHQVEVVYQPGAKAVSQHLKKVCQSGDVIFTLGAGDIFCWHKQILNSLK